jgi:2-polyprenyl-6-methoxyphenol hydroxylase-like FAD-dependent oxidoreductase
MNPHVAQGTNQAMEDATALAEALFDCFDRGAFHERLLSAYEAARRPKVETLQRMGDELTLLWNRGLPLAWVRDRIFRKIARDRPLRRAILLNVAGLAVSPYGWRERLAALWPPAWGEPEG